jgi:hypothetical protein
MSQLHLISEAHNAVMNSSRQHHDFCSFFGSAREVVVLWILHSFTHFMSQNDQSFSCYLSHATLKRPPQCGCLDHLANEANMIDRRPLIDHHTYMPKVWVPTKQSRGSDEERGSLYPSARSTVRRVLEKSSAFWPLLWDSVGTTFQRGSSWTCFLAINFILAI